MYSSSRKRLWYLIPRRQWISPPLPPGKNTSFTYVGKPNQTFGASLQLQPCWMAAILYHLKLGLGGNRSATFGIIFVEHLCFPDLTQEEQSSTTRIFKLKRRKLHCMKSETRRFFTLMRRKLHCMQSEMRRFFTLMRRKLLWWWRPR